MSKIIEKIVSQSTAPSDKNVGWWNGKELKFYTNGEWKSDNNASTDDSYSLSDYFNNTPHPTIKVEINTDKSLKELGVPKEYYDKLVLLKSLSPSTNLSYYIDFEGYHVYENNMDEEYMSAFTLESDDGDITVNCTIDISSAMFSAYIY
jgi:hypothetical protein